MSRKRKEYALYKGDKLVVIGTVKEIAKKLDVSEKTVFFFGSPTYKKRTTENARRLIKIDE